LRTSNRDTSCKRKSDAAAPEACGAPDIFGPRVVYAGEHPGAKEDDMRALLLTMAAGAGLGLTVLATAPAGAITIAAPAGVRQAADGLKSAEPVHCRRYRHRHREGHGWGRGCRVGSGSIVAPEPGVRLRDPALLTVPRPLGANPSNPQDRSGISNPQDRTVPRAMNPQDMTR
jgi:hypothetical protein